MINSLSIIEIKGVPILEQLRLEEALLRSDTRNICLLNCGTPPAIVLGISACPDEMVCRELVEKDNILLIKRFSGGGTVYVDEKTLFVTFIWQKEALEVPPFPREIMKFSERIYAPLFGSLPFSLRENDYVIGEKKVGGNAQYLQKGRFLHHTSFLWDFDPLKMHYLRQPKKQPEYRQNRPHHDFLTTLAPHFPSTEIFIESLKLRLTDFFSIQNLSYEEAKKALLLPHRQATTVL